MPVPVSATPWGGSLAWFALLPLVAFAVSWVGADLLHLRRRAYIGLMSVGYLVTPSPLTPVVAHVLSHLSALQRGVELPPHERGSWAAGPPARTPARTA